MKITNRVHSRIITIMLLLICPTANAITSGKTFFKPRATGQDAVLTQAMNIAFVNQEDPCLAIDTTTFYQQSTNADDLARYFFPNCKSEIIIKEQVDSQTDVWAGWLGISGLTGNFASTVAIRPRHRSFGTVVHLHKNLSHSVKNMWMSATMPFVQVEHDLNLTECCRQDAALSFDQLPVQAQLCAAESSLNACQAFRHPLLRYAKMKNGVQKLAGLADITFNLGYTYEHEQKKCIARLYGSFIAPMGYKPNPEYAFAPIIGNGRHFGFGAGADLEFELSHTDHHRASLISHFTYHYLLRGVEKRTFDLTSRGPWSRYVSVLDNNNKAIGFQFAANFLTQEMFITPKSVINYMLSLRGTTRSSFRYEMGYNMYYRAEEDVRLRNPLPTNILLTDIPFTIAQDSGPAPDTNTPLNTCDADLRSATHPTILSHQFYMATGFAGTIHHNPCEMSVGGSYEFAHKNVSIDKWGLFFKINLAI